MDTDDPAQPVKQEVAATDDMEIEKKEQVQNDAVDSTDKSGESSNMEVEEDQNNNNNAAEEEVEVIEDSGSSQPMQASTDGTADTSASGEGDQTVDTDDLDISNFDTTLPGFQSLTDDTFSCESDFEILKRQMVSDIPLQRLVSTKQIVPSAPRFGPVAMQKLMKRIKEIANDKEIVIRQTLASQLGGLAEYFMKESEKGKPELTKDGALKIIREEILPVIQQMLLDNVEVRQSASKSLVQIAKLLPEEVIHQDVLRIVLHLAHDEMDEHKITALPLLGDLAPVVGPKICANYLAQDLHALSQDNSFRVRKATVQVFGAVCSQMGEAKTENLMVNKMLELYQKLATDNIWSVRKGCVESIVELSKAVRSETRLELVSLMEKFLKDTSRWVRNTAYEFLGPFLSTLDSSQISAEFLQSFTNIPKLKSAEADTESCNHCAYNFPAVVLTVGRERWDELRESYMLLLKKTFKSRKTLACSLHEIAKILGTEIVERDLLQAFELFHKDIDDIREGVLKHFADFLSVMSEKKRDEHLATLWEISSEMDANWRFRLLLASQLTQIMTLYKADTVSEQIIPLAFQLCDDKMNDVRYEAIKSVPNLVKFMKENGNDQQYQDTLKKTRGLAKNRTYARRQLYVELCRHALTVLDNETFEKELLPSLLQFTKDPVANVRLPLARIIKDLLEPHDFFGKHAAIQTAIQQLRDDPEDVEVVRFFRDTSEELNEWSEKRKIRQEQQAKAQTASPPVTQTQSPQNPDTSPPDASATTEQSTSTAEVTASEDSGTSMDTN